MKNDWNDRPENQMNDRLQNTWRRIQDEWLQTDVVQERIKCSSWDTSICVGMTNITYRDVRERLYPNWHAWMRDHARQAS